VPKHILGWAKSDPWAICCPGKLQRISKTRGPVSWEFMACKESLATMNKNKMMRVFWDIAPCNLRVEWHCRSVYCLHHLEDDGGSTHLWNVALLQDYAALYSRTLSSSYLTLWEPEISREQKYFAGSNSHSFRLFLLFATRSLLVGLPESSGCESGVIPSQHHYTMVLHAHISPEEWTIGPLVAAVQRHRSTPSTWSPSHFKMEFGWKWIFMCHHILSLHLCPTHTDFEVLCVLKHIFSAHSPFIKEKTIWNGEFHTQAWQTELIV
jgi:hypothetical protein